MRKKDVNISFLRRIFDKGNVTAASLSYGKAHEESAKAKYLELHPNIHIHKCGLIIHPKVDFLGASPDGKVCDAGECGLLEVKCP